MSYPEAPEEVKTEDMGEEAEFSSGSAPLDGGEEGEEDDTQSNSSDYSAIAASLPDNPSQNQLAEAYGLNESTLRGYKEGRKPHSAENRRKWKAINRYWKQESRKWVKR